MEPLTADNPVAPVNNFLHSMFSNIQIELNQKSITPMNGLYGYRAIIENLLNYGAEAKETHLTSSLFYKDTAGSMTAVDDNAGYLKRREYAQSGEFDMESHIHADIFNQNKYMLNGIHFLIKFYRAKADFCLITKSTDNVKYKVKITDATLIIRKLKMAPALLIAHAQTMNKYTAKYPISRVELKSVTIPAFVQNQNLNNILLGQMPRRIIVLFVDGASFSGTLKTNPFDFQHFNHTFLNTSTDSSMHVTPLKPNFETKLYISSYNSIFNATGVNFSDAGCNISRHEYANGYAMSVFDLTPDISSHETFWSATSSGSLRIEVNFAESLGRPITAIIYAEFNSLIEIDRHRNVVLDYSA